MIDIWKGEYLGQQWIDVIGGMLYVWMDLHVLVYGCIDGWSDGWVSNQTE